MSDDNVHQVQVVGPGYMYTGPELEDAALRERNAAEFFETYDVKVVNGVAEVRRKWPTDRPARFPADFEWRRLLWLKHGCGLAALYGDDGELQCHACKLDFRRMTAGEVESFWFQREVERLQRKQESS